MKFWQWLFWAAVALYAIDAWIVHPGDYQLPRDGEACGAGYHWEYVRANVTDPDLSCEPNE